MLQLLIENFQTNILPNVLQILITLSPIILVCILLMMAWQLWLRYIRSKYFLSLDYIVLEIKLPKDTFKSPLAMELFLESFHNPVDGTPYDKYWHGEVRPWWSLEMISIEGQVKFLIWLQKRRRSFIESSLYAQFPGIEIREIDDYARSVYYDPKEIAMWGTEFKFSKDDPYPIKTYIDYGLDKDPKEEYKVDPLVPLIEYLGSVGPNQQVWFQIIIRAHTRDQKDPKHWFKTTDLWKDKAEELINKLMIRDKETKITGKKAKPEDKEKFPRMPTLTEGEKDIIKALERSISKHAFDVGVRAVYISKKDSFNGSNIGGIIGSMKQFSAEHLNGFRPGGPWRIEYPWQDFRNIRKNRKMSWLLQLYKRRWYFYPPYTGKIMVMNAEELATLFHFPGSVAATPTFERVPSKKTQAPANLPI